VSRATGPADAAALSRAAIFFPVVVDFAGGLAAGAAAGGFFDVSAAAGAAVVVVVSRVAGITAESGVTAAAPVVSVPAPGRVRSPPHPAIRAKVSRTAA
jgi:hypothetical protein